MENPVTILCQAILALDKLAQACVVRDNAEQELSKEETFIVESLAHYASENVGIPIEKQDYIVVAYLASADLRRLIASDTIGMVEIEELLEIQKSGFLTKKKVEEEPENGTG